VPVAEVAPVAPPERARQPAPAAAVAPVADAPAPAPKPARAPKIAAAAPPPAPVVPRQISMFGEEPLVPAGIDQDVTATVAQAGPRARKATARLAKAS
jgi:hypothetical protein